jgi:L-aspartate oxidase
MPGSEIYDVIIIGSGGAGLSLALKLAKAPIKIAVLSKLALTDGSTYYAQGGISAVFDANDSIESHIEDTLIAGAGLCDPQIVRLTVTHGKSSIDWLREQGVVFTQEETGSGEVKLHLNREGGHSHRRIVHTADATGKAVSLSLIQKARQQSNIILFEHHNVVELITTPNTNASASKRIIGAYVLDTRNQAVKTFSGRAIALATGGASKVYLYSTNPQSSTGDGIALAWRAGCRIANMEFMQFHPTCLYHPNAQSFLISEAVRGEGGKLILPDGTPFMQRFDPRGELAPRDIVARAIDHEIKKRGIDCVFLDISHKSADFIFKHFPTIYEQCLKYGIDITQQPIPVVPAAHYTCGGILTDSYARTDIDNLYAIGEAASTGLHGANRMASNSLLECLVFADRACESILSKLESIPLSPPIRPWDESMVSDSDEEVVVSHNWNELRTFMWDYVGIVRTDKRLTRAMNRIELLKKEIAEYYSHFRVTNDLLELRNLVIVGELIIRCAQQRKESRGLHYTLDYPETDTARPAQNTILKPN